MTSVWRSLPADPLTTRVALLGVEGFDDPSVIDDQDTGDVDEDAGYDEALEYLELNAQLRLELGRRITIALLEEPNGGGPAFDAFLAMLTRYPEVRVLLVRAAPANDAGSLAGALAEALRDGADSLLVWTDDPMDGDIQADRACSQGEQWARLVVSVADHMQLFESCFVALIGESVSRKGARRLGFDDGFAIGAPVDNLLRTLVRDVLARDAYRRRGASPPCFL